MHPSTPTPLPVETWSAQYGDELERHVSRMLGNVEEARDIVQDLWVTAIRTEPDWGDGSNIRAWLYRVASRRALDAISARKRRARLLESRATELRPERLDAPDAAFRTLSDEAAEAVRRQIAALPCKQRNAVWLRWIEGHDYDTIAERLDSSPDGARANVYQGMKKLRRELADVWKEEVVR